MDAKHVALKAHEDWRGKIEVISRATINTPEELAVAYTPGVAEPCLKIAEDGSAGRVRQEYEVEAGTALLGRIARILGCKTEELI